MKIHNIVKISIFCFSTLSINSCKEKNLSEKESKTEPLTLKEVIAGEWVDTLTNEKNLLFSGDGEFSLYGEKMGSYKLVGREIKIIGEAGKGVAFTYKRVGDECMAFSCPDLAVSFLCRKISGPKLEKNPEKYEIPKMFVGTFAMKEVNAGIEAGKIMVFKNGEALWWSKAEGKNAFRLLAENSMMKFVSIMDDKEAFSFSYREDGKDIKITQLKINGQTPDYQGLVVDFKLVRK